ncbi:MAG: hypothetical protein ACOC44_00575 [Promethearchaeia archaeon]
MLQNTFNLINLFWGILLSASASFLFALGVALQKKAVSEMEEITYKNLDSVKEMFQNRLWVLGIIIATAGGLPYILVTSLIGVALTQPLTLGLQLAFVVILGMKMLQEKIKRIEKIGFSIILLSPIFIALGNVTPPDVNMATSDFQINFAILLIIIIMISCILGGIALKFKDHIIFAGLSMALISGILFGMGALLNQVGVVLIQYDLTLLIIGLAFFLMMFICNTLATGLQQIAFQKSKIGIAIGLQSTANLLLAVMGGIFAFNQYVNLPIFFIIGIIMIIVGNGLLVQFQARIEEIDNTTTLTEDPNNLK